MRLTSAELATMRAEHRDDGGSCASCWAFQLSGGRMDLYPVVSPCDAAKLLAHFAPGPVPHLAGIAMGLLGPVDQSELPPVPARKREAPPKLHFTRWKDLNLPYAGTVRLPVGYGCTCSPKRGVAHTCGVIPAAEACEAQPDANGQTAEADSRN